MIVTREYKEEKKAEFKQTEKDLKQLASRVRKDNKKLIKAMADFKNHVRLSLCWTEVTRFQADYERFYKGRMSTELYNEFMEKVINPLLPNAKKAEELYHHVNSLTLFPMKNTDSCYVVCRDIFKKWKPTKIKDGQIYVNGQKVGKRARVGVIIGAGERIHGMEIFVGKDDTLVIANHTQWMRSNLLIVDLVEKMPKEAFSKI